ncbi:response regulator transcription factor [Pseudanabaena sp. FACHB-2040]|uniref:response regulator n=1 Tax=Pseudanabaena sp. FACHB-2040 TaxID=2692859 RepID=UPI001688BB8A|nr:response regulator transcription factor [Pseudanabaena sp. FACHB-2040]MBD2259471.1 response regulator transcription factor [Pseudanabaena sp. FACHB-2040]
MTTRSPASLKLLIVDDDPMMRLGLTAAIASQPDLLLLGEAVDGQQGLEQATALQPDVVLMDVGMPVMDGIAATQAIKAAAPTVRVVMLTSHTDETEIIAAFSSGADAYCIKGTDVDALANAIRVAATGAAYLDPQIAQKVMQNLAPARPKAAGGGDGLLSDRELEVLELIVEGFSNTEIGQKLYLSPNTVKTYVKGIMNKLVVSDRVQAAVVAVRRGLV